LFATAFPLSGFGSGVLVRSHEGRPVKVEGNPSHPASEGGANLFALASILELYDPDRSKQVTHNGLPAPHEQGVQAVRDRIAPGKGAGVRILTGTVTSPTLANRIEKLLTQLPGAKWAIHEPAAQDNVRDGTRLAFDKLPRNVWYDFSKADVVVSL